MNPVFFKMKNVLAYSSLIIVVMLSGCVKENNVSSVTPSTETIYNTEKNLKTEHNSSENNQNKMPQTVTDTTSVVLVSENSSNNNLFWLGMKEEDVVVAIKNNNMEILKNDGLNYDDLGAEIIDKSKNSLLDMGVNYSLSTTGFLLFDFDKDKLLISVTMQAPPWQEEVIKISSSYSTEKGIKLKDSFDKVKQMYGEPFNISDKDNQYVYTYKINDALYMFFCGTIANGTNEVNYIEYTSDADIRLYP